MAWGLLALASLFEVAFAVALKAADGFTRPGPSILAIAAGVVSLVFLTFAMRTLPVSVAYPAWGAFGTLGTVVLGAALFGEPINAAKIASVLAILVGIVGLKLQAA